MNVLYRGGYRRRYEQIFPLIDPQIQSVCELCFGDTLLASWCLKRGIQWTGFDLNQSFCARAQKMGFNAILGDVLSLDLPKSDAYIMAGSLYHFHSKLPELFEAILSRTKQFIICEPVRNLSSASGWIGSLAKRAANPGDGNAEFRYDERTLLGAIREQQSRLNFKYRVVTVDRDLLLEIRSN
jgi:hypothetical protein